MTNVLPEQDIRDEADPWRVLANAVVMQAVKDYRDSRAMLRKLKREMTVGEALSKDAAALMKRHGALSFQITSPYIPGWTVSPCCKDWSVKNDEKRRCIHDARCGA